VRVSPTPREKTAFKVSVVGCTLESISVSRRELLPDRYPCTADSNVKTTAADRCTSRPIRHALSAARAVVRLDELRMPAR
jgi:hypothetical protein